MNDQVGKVRICAVGDIALCDGVEEQISRHGAKHPFENIAHLLSESDIRFGNLESVFTRCDNGLMAQAHLLRSNPESLRSLVDAGFTVVSVANNHIMDFGEKGLSDTLEHLGAAGIAHCGAGFDLSSARRAAIVKSQGLSFGFLAYAMKGVHSAIGDRSGAAWIDRQAIFEDIQAVQGKVDHIVISLHAGLEFIDYPHPQHRDLCREIVGRGASLVLGHGPHVIQGVEQVSHGLIVYGLGNMIFDTKLMDYKTERSHQGLIFRGSFTKNELVDYEIVPTILNSRFQVDIAEGVQKETILKRLRKISEELTSENYPQAYFAQATALWPKINIAVNLKVIKTQGLRAFIKRLPRLKKIYIILFVRYVLNRTLNCFRGSKPLNS